MSSNFWSVVGHGAAAAVIVLISGLLLSLPTGIQDMSIAAALGAVLKGLQLYAQS